MFVYTLTSTYTCNYTVIDALLRRIWLLCTATRLGALLRLLILACVINDSRILLLRLTRSLLVVCELLLMMYVLLISMIRARRPIATYTVALSNLLSSLIRIQLSRRLVICLHVLYSHVKLLRLRTLARRFTLQFLLPTSYFLRPTAYFLLSTFTCTFFFT